MKRLIYIISNIIFTLIICITGFNIFRYIKVNEKNQNLKMKLDVVKKTITKEDERYIELEDTYNQLKKEKESQIMEYEKWKNWNQKLKEKI